MEKEVWKNIVGYEGLYQVSNYGRVRSIDRYVNSKWGNQYIRKGKILNPGYNKSGHSHVVLCKSGKHQQCYIHRLVAEAFIPNPNDYPIINHKDENPANNAVWNLEWCTQEYNLHYGNADIKKSEALSNAMKGKRKGKDNPASKAVLMFTKEGDFIRRFDCAKDAGIFLGYKNGNNITMCCLGKSKTAYGFIFKYELN